MEQQLELLWQYQQVDMEVERFEREMRQAPNRQKLLKQREFLMEQQNVVKRIEQEVAIMSDRMEAIRDEIIPPSEFCRRSRGTDGEEPAGDGGGCAQADSAGAEARQYDHAL